MMKMYQIKKESSSLFLKPEEFKDSVISDYLEKGETYELFVIDMFPDEINNLPELEHFD